MYATFIDMYYYIIALISSKWISNASEFWTLICCYSNKLDIWCGYWKKNKLISSISATNINKPNKINSYFILVGFRSARLSNLTIVRHSHSLFMSTHTSLHFELETLQLVKLSQLTIKRQSNSQQLTFPRPAPSGVPVSERVTVVSSNSNRTSRTNVFRNRNLKIMNLNYNMVFGL